MRWKVFLAAALLIPALGAVGWPGDQTQIRELIQQKKIVLGQAQRDVRAAIGEPTKITRIQTYWDSTEDWIYGEGKDAVSFTFEEGRLTRITDGERSAIN
jgi:hypothetical protein